MKVISIRNFVGISESARLEQDNNIDMEKTNLGSINKNMTSHYEDYYSALHNEELPTKYLKNKHTVIMEDNEPLTTNAVSVRQT